MLVRFISSAGEILMFARAAGSLLQVLGKETTAKGAFLPDEMMAAAQSVEDCGEPRRETPRGR